MALKTRPFDPAEYLDSPEAIAAYIDDAMATGDLAFIADAIGVVARAGNVSALARDTGLSRQAVYTSLSKGGNPELGTVVKVLGALGVRLKAVPAASQPEPVMA